MKIYDIKTIRTEIINVLRAGLDISKYPTIQKYNRVFFEDNDIRQADPVILVRWSFEANDTLNQKATLLKNQIRFIITVYARNAKDDDELLDNKEDIETCIMNSVLCPRLKIVSSQMSLGVPFGEAVEITLQVG